MTLKTFEKLVKKYVKGKRSLNDSLIHYFLEQICGKSDEEIINYFKEWKKEQDFLDTAFK